VFVPEVGGITWQTPEFALAAGARRVIPIRVLLDEGGGEGRDAATLANADRLIATLTVRPGGMPNEWMPGAVDVVSAAPRRVKVAVMQSYGANTARTTLLDRTVALQPGLRTYLPFDIVPPQSGRLTVEALVTDDSGQRLGSASASTLIDGSTTTGEDQKVWTAYAAKLPEFIYEGTWEEIGAKMNADRRVLDKKEAKQLQEARLTGAEEKERVAKALAFYARKFPFYARLLKGAAGDNTNALRRFVQSDALTPALERRACLDIFFNGPDGPINAFSKERSGMGQDGLEYTRVVPDKGYAFHTYMHSRCGINAAGLASTTASINADPDTVAEGERLATERRKAGKFVAPPWMLLAMCKDVPEALAFIADEEAPLEFTGNMLLVDRAGRAARVESCGILRQVTLCDNPPRAFFCAGNYPHAAPDGRFQIGENKGWAANTMCRERFLDRNYGSQLGRIALRDVFRIMETHWAGGMCQHLHDNPGRLFTSCSLVAVCRTGDLYLTMGPPCQVRTYRYTLPTARASQ
jgi:hypothetical protein